jgi:hypothetical protein
LLNNLSPTDNYRNIYTYEGTDETNILVYIEVLAFEGKAGQLKSILEGAPYNMTGFIDNGPGSLKISGKIAISKICNLEYDAVFEELIDDAVPFDRYVASAGNAYTIGDSTQGSIQLREGYGLQGEGIKIGVLSDSYDKRPLNSGTTADDDIFTNDLPGKTNPAEKVVVVKEYPFTGTDEGRAMLQIIHDIAPKAKLFFRTGTINASDMAQGIRDMSNPNGTIKANILVDDITFPREPVFRDGVVAQAVEYAVSQGVAYFSSGIWATRYSNTFSATNALATINTTQPNSLMRKPIPFPV